MNKLMTKIVGATLGLAMVVGVGVGFASSKEAKAAYATTVPGTFERASIGNLSAGDVVLIVNNSNYAMSNNNGASSAPSAVSVTVSNNAITNPDSTLLWTFGIDNGNYTFLAGTSGSNYLYCTNTNNGVRVGTNSNKTFTVDGGYLKNVATSRYVGVYNNSDWRCYTSSGGNIANQTFSYFKQVQSSFGELDHIKVNTPASKLAFETGETFTSAGLVLIGYDGANEAEANAKTYSSGFTTNFDGHTFVSNEIGSQTVTVTHTASGKQTTYQISVSAGPDYVIDGDTKAPEGMGTDTSTTATAQGSVDGINYSYYAFAINDYNSEKNLEFNRDVQNAYFGNSESYGKYISKIRLTLKYENNFSKLSLYKGNSPIPGETIVTSNDSGSATHTYNFGDDCEYFSLKQTTTGSWIVITKIEIFLGSNIPVISSVSAQMTGDTYYAGTTLSESDFYLTVNWTEGKPATHPASGFTWTVNGTPNGTLGLGNNSVVVTYSGVSTDPAIVVEGVSAAASVIIANTDTQSSLTYRYDKVDTTTTDTLNRTLTGITGSNYTGWSGKTSQTNVVYAGNSAGGNESIQLRTKNSNSGIVTTSNSNGYDVKSITITWNSETASGRIVDIYGNDTAYSSASDLYSNNSQGTLIASLAYADAVDNVSVLTLDDSYQFIGIKSHGDALYLSSVSIVWITGNPTFNYSRVAMRFGGSVSTSLWSNLNDESAIQGYGVLFSTITNWTTDELKDYYNLVDGVDVKDFYTPITNTHTNPTESNGAYIWNLFKVISEDAVASNNLSILTTGYTAVAYIKTAAGLVFFKQTVKSVSDLATDLLAADASLDTTLEGSLADLANL